MLCTRGALTASITISALALLAAGCVSPPKKDVRPRAEAMFQALPAEAPEKDFLDDRL